MRKEHTMKRLYEGLAGPARLRAAMELAGAGDVSEAEHVLDSAHWVDVRAKDPEMIDAFHDLRSLLMEFDRMSAVSMSWLDAIDSIRPYVLNVVDGIRRDEPSPWLAELALDVIDGTVEMVARELSAYRTAYLEAGDERLGLSERALLAILPRWCARGLERHAERIEASEPSDESLTNARRTIVLGWGPDDLGSKRQPGED